MHRDLYYDNFRSIDHAPVCARSMKEGSINHVPANIKEGVNASFEVDRSQADDTPARVIPV